MLFVFFVVKFLMSFPMIDLRSDTVTKPTPGMLQAMLAAAVGDDVYGEDPTINALEAKVAAYLGMDAALFVPSGTMSNQLAVRCHCQPGDELLIESTSHIYLWEAGGPAVHSGVTCRTIDTPNGLLSVEMLDGKIRPDDPHSVRTRLVSLENTHNRGGGTVYPLATIAVISKWARDNHLLMHLDGARLWNAVVASGDSAKTIASHFDSVSVCFSKGLGAPVGSALAGSKEFIAKARRARKLFGGAMRQAGFLAAACIYAMDNHIERLREDHANAKLLAEAVRQVPGLTLNPATVETNLVWVDVDPKFGTAQHVVAEMKAAGVLCSALGKQTVRMCTHYDVSKADCETAAKAIMILTS
ncbi:low-specificity L-threonine aldolase [soil metagenome]